MATPKPAGGKKAKSYVCFVCNEKSNDRGIPLLVGETTVSRICLGEKLQEILGDRFVVLVNRNDSVCWRCAVKINSFDKYEHKIDIIRDFIVDHISSKYKDAKVSLSDLISNDDKTNKKVKLSDVDGTGESIKKVGKRGAIKRPIGRPPAKKKAGPHSDPKANASPKHLDDAPVGTIIKVFACRFCSKKYETENEMKKHVVEKHPPKYLCHVCDSSFSTLSRYNVHMKIHMFPKPKLLTCVSCGFKTKNTEVYCRHVCNAKVVSLTCTLCKKHYVDSEFKKSDGDQAFLCPTCAAASKEKLEIDNRKIQPKHTLSSTESKSDSVNKSAAPVAMKPALKHSVSEGSKSKMNSNLTSSEEPVPPEATPSLSSTGSILIEPTEEPIPLTDMNSRSVPGHTNFSNKAPSELDEVSPAGEDHSENPAFVQNSGDGLLKNWEEDNATSQPVSCEEDGIEQNCVLSTDIMAVKQDVILKHEEETQSEFAKNSYLKCSHCNEAFEINNLPTHPCLVNHGIAEYSEVDPPDIAGHSHEMSVDHQNSLQAYEDASAISYIKTEMFNDSKSNLFTDEPVLILHPYDSKVKRKKIPNIPALENSALNESVVSKIQCKTCDLEFSTIASLREHWDVTGHSRQVNTTKVTDVNKFTDKEKKQELTFKVFKQKFSIRANIPGENELAAKARDPVPLDMFVKVSDEFKSDKECSTCGHIFPTVEMRKHHQQTDCLICQTCGITFLDNKLLKKHYQYTGHSPKPPVGKIAKILQAETASDEVEVVENEKDSLTTPSGPEPVSEEKQDEMEVLVEEAQSVITTPTVLNYQCNICQKQFVSRFDLGNHVQSHFRESMLGICHYCLNEFEDKSALSNHMFNVHGAQMFFCKHCECVFTSEHLRNKHQALKHLPKVNACLSCQLNFVSERALVLHNLRNHSETTCKICGFNVYNFEDLQGHVDKHSCNKGLRCSECNILFKKYHHYRDHIFMHLGGKVWNCEYCHLVFRSRISFHDHRLNHLKKKWKCSRCEAQFMSKMSYWRHCKTHDSRYICNSCGLSFRRTSLLAVHKKRSHMRAHPYHCPLCPFTCSVSSTMKRHMRVHKKPIFHCAYCKRGFLSQGSFVRHMAVRHNLRVRIEKEVDSAALSINPSDEDLFNAADTLIAGENIFQDYQARTEQMSSPNVMISNEVVDNSRLFEQLLQ